MRCLTICPLGRDAQRSKAGTALSFITPLFLFGAATVLLPVLFHFVRRMKARRVPFSSLMLLKATPKELVKRRRLRDLLLLALRATMLLLLALAFARPFIPQDRIPFVTDRQEQSVAILVDLSYSMQVSGVFEQARSALVDRIDTAREGDELSVIGFSDAARQLTRLSDDHALHRSVASGLAPGYRATDFHAPLRLAADILQDARYDDRVVVLISDFQRNGFSGSFENFDLGSDIDFISVKVTKNDLRNTYVESFELSTRRTGDAVALRLDARIESQGQNVHTDQVVNLNMDGEVAAQRTVPGAPSVPVTFRQSASRTGFFQGSLSLAEDDLAADNRYYFTVRVTDRPSILAVDRGPERRDAFFLASAFALGENARFSFETGDLRRAAIRDPDIVFAANFTSCTDAEIATLLGVAERGGSVILSFGDQVSPQAYSAALQKLGIGTSDRIVTPRASQGSDAIVGQVEERHPIFKILATSGRGGILRPVFRRYLRVEPDSGASVLATYDTGDPLLLERRIGQGTLLVYTASFSTQWTDFALHELYLPFLYQMALYAYNPSEAQYHYAIGAPVPVRGRAGEEWDVQAPDGNVFKVVVDASGTGFFRETEIPGHYAAAHARETFSFSVNVDPRESLLETRNEEEAYAAIAASTDEVATVPEEALLLVQDEEKEQKLWRVVVIVLLVLFAMESHLASRSSQRSSPTAG